MALTFGAATSDRVSASLAAAATDLQALTMWAIVYPTTIAANRHLIDTNATDTGTATGFRSFSVRSTGQLNYEGDMDLVDVAARSSNDASNTLAVNKWWFVAATISSAFVPKLYLADLSILNPVAECTYATQTTGLTATVTDSGGFIKVGNRINNTGAFQGRIAVAGYENAELSLGQLKQLAYWPRRLASNVYYAHCGYNGTTNVPDWSGNGQTGTITGATVSAHVPLGPFFGLDRYLTGSAVVGRTTKNTRANPLGIKVGMGWRMPA